MADFELSVRIRHSNILGFR